MSAHEHVSDDRIAGYRARGLSRQETEALEGHLSTCADCRARVLAADRAGISGAALLGQMLPSGSDHLEYEALLAYVRREDDPIDREIAASHLEDCPVCRESEQDLRTFLAERSALPHKVYAPARRHKALPAFRPGWPILAPVALALLVLIIVGTSLFRTAPEAPVVARRPESITPPAAASKPDLEVPKPKPDTGRPPAPPVKRPARPRTSVPPASVPVRRPSSPRRTPSRVPEAPVLLASLPEEASSVPAWARTDLERILQTPPVYRSDAVPQGPAIRLVEPDPGNASLVDSRPVFRWEPVEGAKEYTLRLETVPVDIDTAPEVLAQTVVAGPDFQPASPLGRGQTYRISVSATSEEVVLNPVETAWQFRLLSEGDVEQVRWAEENAAKYPVTAAMALYRLDRLADAAEMARRWPERPALAGWKAALKREAERRRAAPAE